MTQAHPPNPVFAVLVPTYNHRRFLSDLLEQMRDLDYTLIIIDDGSTDETADILESVDAHTHAGSAHVLSHTVNRGKAAALHTGFDHAQKLGCTHAITIDADGQLDPADIPLLAEASVKHPEALIVGCRPDRMDGRPKRSALGRQSAGVAIRAQTGIWLGDTQCGLRSYPIERIQSLGCRAERFAFEAEVITKMLWSGGTVIEVPVSCSYEPPGGRVSHYRPVVDSLRQGAMHAKLFGLAMLPLGRAAPAVNKANPPERRRSHLIRFLSWMNPLRSWRELRDSDLGPVEISLAVSLGVFVGTSPFFGLHAPICLYLAWRTRLHPAPMILGSQISIPPVGVALGAASILVGHELLAAILPGERWDAWPALTWQSLPAFTGEVMLAWLVGSFFVGLLLAGVSFVILLAALRWFRKPRSVTDAGA